MRKQIHSDKCGPCHGPYAQGVQVGNLLFTTQIGTDVAGNLVPGGIIEQTKATLDNVKAVLEAGGASMDDVAKVTIHVKDMALVPTMNEVYETYFPADNFPARCCTECSGMADGCVVEMEFVAVLG